MLVRIFMCPLSRDASFIKHNREWSTYKQKQQHIMNNNNNEFKTTNPLR